MIHKQKMKRGRVQRRIVMEEEEEEEEAAAEVEEAGALPIKKRP